MLSIFHNSYIPINIKTQINTKNNQMDKWVREREIDNTWWENQMEQLQEQLLSQKPLEKAEEGDEYEPIILFILFPF